MTEKQAIEKIKTIRGGLETFAITVYGILDQVRPDPTVREVVERAYGPVPERATVHVDGLYNDGEAWLAHSVYCECGAHVWRVRHGAWMQDVKGWQWMSVGPDISDRPFSAFLGFWPECDKAYAEIMAEREGGNG